MVIVLLQLMLLLQGGGPSQTKASAQTTVTGRQIQSLIKAVQDEIYDYGFEDDYVGVGTNRAVPGSAWRSEVPIYVRPTIENGEGAVIYNLKHYGEIYRVFSIENDGLVVLDGDPELGFPRTQASLMTKYMQQSDVARMKRDWLRKTYEVETAPDTQIVRAAADRQKERTGFSYWESFVLPHLPGYKDTRPNN